MLLSALFAAHPVFAEPPASLGTAAQHVAKPPESPPRPAPFSITEPAILVAGFLLAAGACAGLLLLWWIPRRGGKAQRVEAPRTIVPQSTGKFAGPERAESMGLTPLDQSTTVVEELDSAEEEAEVFMVLGRMDMAIGVLRHYIESQPDASPRVWLALLDILHSEGLRGEFEKLALEMKARFNVALPTWEKANQQSSGLSALEHFPHLLAKIDGMWNGPDCLGYLRGLIHDNREGGRSGFHQEVFRELLLLAGILECRAKASV